MYGAQQRPTTTPNEAWVAAVRGLSDERIIKALSTLADGGYTFWPSIPEFVKASKGLARDEREAAAGPRYLGVPISQEQRSRLLAYMPKRDRSAAMRATNETLAILGRPPKYSEAEILEVEALGD